MKLNMASLRRLVNEEVEALKNADGKKTPEPEVIDPGEEADTLEKKIDIAKALKIKEAKLRKQADQLAERRRRILTSLIEGK